MLTQDCRDAQRLASRSRRPGRGLLFDITDQVDGAFSPSRGGKVPPAKGEAKGAAFRRPGCVSFVPPAARPSCTNVGARCPRRTIIRRIGAVRAPGHSDSTAAVGNIEDIIDASGGDAGRLDATGVLITHHTGAAGIWVVDITKRMRLRFHPERGCHNCQDAYESVKSHRESPFLRTTGNVVIQPHGYIPRCPRSWLEARDGLYQRKCAS